VVAVVDGGGLVPAARRPIEGADKVAKIFAAFSKVEPEAHVGPMVLNGTPALRIERDGQLKAAISLVIEAGRVTRVYAVANPHKLAQLATAIQLRRASLSSL
jgi:hypothetical protein